MAKKYVSFVTGYHKLPVTSFERLVRDCDYDADLVLELLSDFGFNVQPNKYLDLEKAVALVKASQ